MLFPPLIIHKQMDKSNDLMQLLLLSLLNIVIPRKPARISIVLLLSTLIIVVSIPPLKSLFTSSHLLALPKVPSIHPPPLLICPLFTFFIHTFNVLVSFLHRRHATIFFVVSLVGNADIIKTAVIYLIVLVTSSMFKSTLVVLNSMLGSSVLALLFKLLGNHIILLETISLVKLTDAILVNYTLPLNVIHISLLLC